MAKAGANIFITSTTDRILDRIHELRGLFGKDRVEGLPADLTDEKQVQKLVYETQRSFSKVDILVNNAGMVQVGHDQPSSKFEQLLSKTGTFDMPGLEAEVRKEVVELCSKFPIYKHLR